MKIKTLCYTLLALMSGRVALAQTNAVETNTVASTVPSGGLLIEDQSEQRRIDLLLDVASVYCEEENYAAAADAYERVLEIDPENKQARYIISHVYINSKQYAKAVKLLNELIEENPEDFQLKNNLAWLYATADNPAYRNGEKAIELAQEAMVLAPNDHHVWSTLAEAHYVTGDYEKAYRDIKHMANLATRYGNGITKEMVDGYNEQINKCKRALDSQKALVGEEVEAGKPEEQPAVDTSDVGE